MSYNVVFDTPVQCEEQIITWSGWGNETKGVYVWREDTNYFFEKIVTNLTAALGTFTWTCDVPAGAWIALEVLSMPDAARYATTPFKQVQPGKTDACLGKNEGQLATASMAALASSLSSASPQLFTGYTTATTNTSSFSTAAPTTTSDTSVAAEPTSSGDSSEGINAGAVAGGAVGGAAAVILIAALIFWLLKRRNRSRLGSSPSGTEKGTVRGTPSADEGEDGGRRSMGFFRAVSTNPVDAWRRKVEGGRPASAWTRRSRTYSMGTAAQSPLSPPRPPVSLPGNSPTVTSPPTLGASPNPFASISSSGPRAGVPEVGEETDFRPAGSYYTHTTANSSPHTSLPFSQLNDLPDPSSFERGGGGGGGATTSYPPVPASSSMEMLQDSVSPLAAGDTGGAMVRPPTRLTTPGGLTSYDGEGGRGGESVGSGSERGGTVPYASYARQ
ncbi:hypothetical protein JCM8547_006876 [Rhodosporidiobolus lusitaniae]